MRKLRSRVLIALGIAFAIEVCSRSIHAATDTNPLVTESMSMVALLLLCGSALYLISLLRDTPLITWSIILATVFLLSSQVLDIVQDLPGLGDGFLHSAFFGQLQGMLLLAGFILMLATLYSALFETIATKQALIKEQSELYSEIAERKQAQAALNESRDSLRRLSAHMEHVREEERTKIAREIHDELGQTLTSLKIDIASLKEMLRSGAEVDKEMTSEILHSMTEQINATMQVVRRIITELRPGILDDLGILAAIEWQARDFEKRSGIPCAVGVNVDKIDLDGEKSTALFRILQEALTNVIRHARASHVDIQVEQAGDYLQLSVQDDGCGMNEEIRDEAHSFGLMGIRERAAQFDGGLELESEPGAGTRLSVTMALNGANKAS